MLACPTVVVAPIPLSRLDWEQKLNEQRFQKQVKIARDGLLPQISADNYKKEFSRFETFLKNNNQTIQQVVR